MFEHVAELEALRRTRVFPFLLMPMTMGRNLVDTSYELLEQSYARVKNLDVLVTSAGGDIHSAYHLAKLLRRYARGRLRFIVPRYAKSAATLLIFGGDEIIFGPTSEMGPLDPQIALSTMEKSRDIQRISPLAIRPALDLIAEEQEKGHDTLVEKLSSSLPDALILGQHLKTLEVGKHYVIKLLTTRMLKDNPDALEIATKIGEQLVSSYPDHGCCIDYDEAKSLGLRIAFAPDKQWTLIWKIWKQAEEHMKAQGAEARTSVKTKDDILST